MLDALSLLTKIGLYSGILLAAGLSLHRLLLPSDHWRLTITGAGLICLFAPLRLFFLNAELAGGLDHSFDFSTFEWIWTPNRAQSLAYIGGALIVGFSAGLRSSALAAAGSILILIGVGLGGHTRSSEAPWLNSFIVSVHVAIAAFWVMAPVVLWPRIKLGQVQLQDRLKRFSALAVWSVPLLFAGGVWLSMQLTGSVGALLETGYGRLILAKLVLASGALAVGAVNKFWVTDRLRDNPQAGRGFLNQMLIVESILFAGVIVTIAFATTLTGPGA